MVKVDKVFVAHVKKGSEHRAIAMEKQLAKLGIEFEYMLDGDIEEITAERLEKYFVKDVENSIVGRSKSHISCALKHILIFEEVVKRNLNRVLILEDDAILTSNFVDKFNKSIDELESLHKPEEPALAFYEATHLQFIPRSVRQRGRVLYKPRNLQCTACYTINKSYAATLLNHLKNNKCDIAIDDYMDRLRSSGIIPTMYQSHPDLCIQGSHTGACESLIFNRGFIRDFGRRFSYFYKKHILYNLR